MKNIIKKIGLLIGTVAVIASCSDFEELNINPTAANVDQVQVEYFINNSIIGAQQDPHIAERTFILYWTDAGRQQRVGSLSQGFDNDGWTSEYYRYVSGWLKDINSAITVSDKKIKEGKVKEYTANLKQIARIWRVYLMSEMADNFGPIPIEGFQSVNPDYNSVEDVYLYLLKELKEATAAIDVSVVNSVDISKWDPAFGYDYVKWRNYGNSMRMRLAMRLSEVAPSVAQENFEDAAKNSAYISSLEGTFEVQEGKGWDALAGVMSRPWWDQFMTTTQNNLMIGLGGVLSSDQLDASMLKDIKSANYMGVKYKDHFTMMTNDPSAGFWFDGLHNTIDPRAYDLYKIPGNFDDPQFNGTGSTDTKKSLIIGDVDNDVNKETDDISIDGAFTWNAFPEGSWGVKGSNNKIYGFSGSLPRLASKFRDGSNKRVFFGSWESYFLIAEASVRGWNVPMSGQAAYEEGISQSFKYNNVSAYISTYLSSSDFNRVGTSVSWSHTTEPSATVKMDYIDGYTGVAGTYNFTYPENTIYRGGSVKNDFLTKIITQKFIAQTPWLPLESWNDQRRLGLPFFENPPIEKVISRLPNLTKANFMSNSIGVFPQRLKYPSGMETSIPVGYQQAVKFLGGNDNIFTPLWWAQH